MNLLTAAAAFRTALLSARYFQGSRNCVDSTVPRLRAGRSAARIPATKSIFLFSAKSRPALVSNQSPIQSVSGIKQPERDAGHSPLHNPQLRNELIYNSPSYVYMLTVAVLRPIHT